MRKLIVKIVLAALPALWNVLGAQNVALSTNLAGYAFLGTMNVEASYALAQHWSVLSSAQVKRTFPRRVRTVSSLAQRCCTAKGTRLPSKVG